MERPQITITVPTLNNPEGLHKMVQTLYEKTPREIFRLIVVDNSNGEAVLPETLPYIDIYIKSYRNLGFAKSFNIGLNISTTPYYGIFNDDLVFIDDRWWQGVLDTFAKGSNIGGVNAMSPRNPYHTGDIISQYPYIENWTHEDVERIKGVFGGDGVIDGICTWATVFRRDVLEEVGRREGTHIAYMDESISLGSGEDYDFNRRFGIAGFRMVASRKVWIWHWWGRTKNNMPEPKHGKFSANYDLIAQGYSSLNNKWGPSMGQGPGQSPNGWDIQGRSGPQIPLDRPFATIVEL